MAIFHRATITPTKEELIAAWAPTQPWGPSADEALHVIGSYRFDDPHGRGGVETHLCMAGDAVFPVPLTDRGEAVDGGGARLITHMSHSVLGDRCVYDGLRDSVFVVMLAGVAMTGQGEALGMVVYEDRWYIAPSNIRIRGGGWGLDRVPVDGFQLIADDSQASVLRNERFELTFFRRPVPGPQPEIGLTATVPDSDQTVVLATVREH